MYNNEYIKRVCKGFDKNLFEMLSQNRGEPTAGKRSRLDSKEKYLSMVMLFREKFPSTRHPFKIVFTKIK